MFRQMLLILGDSSIGQRLGCIIQEEDKDCFSPCVENKNDGANLIQHNGAKPWHLRPSDAFSEGVASTEDS